MSIDMNQLRDIAGAGLDWGQASSYQLTAWRTPAQGVNRRAFEPILWHGAERCARREQPGTAVHESIETHPMLTTGGICSSCESIQDPSPRDSGRLLETALLYSDAVMISNVLIENSGIVMGWAAIGVARRYIEDITRTCGEYTNWAKGHALIETLTQRVQQLHAKLVDYDAELISQIIASSYIPDSLRGALWPNTADPALGILDNDVARKHITTAEQNAARLCLLERWRDRALGVHGVVGAVRTAAIAIGDISFPARDTVELSRRRAALARECSTTFLTDVAQHCVQQAQPPYEMRWIALGYSNADVSWHNHTPSNSMIGAIMARWGTLWRGRNVGCLVPAPVAQTVVDAGRGVILDTFDQDVVDTMLALWRPHEPDTSLHDSGTALMAAHGVLIP